MSIVIYKFYRKSSNTYNKQNKASDSVKPCSHQTYDCCVLRFTDRGQSQSDRSRNRRYHKRRIAAVGKDDSSADHVPCSFRPKYVQEYARLSAFHNITVLRIPEILSMCTFGLLTYIMIYNLYYVMKLNYILNLTFLKICTTNNIIYVYTVGRQFFFSPQAPNIRNCLATIARRARFQMATVGTPRDDRVCIVCIAKCKSPGED